MEEKKRVLLIDDEINTIHALRRILHGDQYEIFSTTVPKEAIEIISNTELDVILCDQRMPEILGTEVLSHARKVCPQTVRMLLTGYSDIQAIASAINEGGIFYYFSKPWNNEELLQKIEDAVSYKKKQVEKEQTIRNYLLERDNWLLTKGQMENQLAANKEKVISSLLKVVKAKDQELFMHSERVSNYALFLADLIGLSYEQKDDLRYAALFHDIGKIAIKDGVLYKPGKLEDNEFEEIKHHTIVGAEIIKELGFMEKVADIILQHHERVDGKGYPNGLKEEQILLEAKILTVADTYDALVSDRVYRKGMDSDRALELLRAESNQRYDSTVVEIFCGGMQNEKRDTVCR